jgi:multicomponent Na+:H+ antiporter subunit D
MNAALLAYLPRASNGLDWSLIVLLIALAGSAAAFAARERPGLSFASGLLVWVAIAAVIAQAWRAGLSAHPTLVTAAGITVAGFLAWVCAPATAIPARRRGWIPALALTLAGAGFGANAAPDFLVLTIWLAVMGGACFALVLAVAGDLAEVRALLMGEALALVTAVLALVVLGLARGGPNIESAPPGLAAAGLILLAAHLTLRIAVMLAGLGIAARPGILAGELALGALAVPTLVATLLRVLTELAHLPIVGVEEFVAVLGGALTLIAACAFVVARGRGPRLASIAASLAGIAVLMAGTGALGTDATVFAELLFVPFAAIIAGSSLRGAEIATRDGVKPMGFGGALELALAVAALGVIGLPPFAGFWPRLVLMNAAVKSGDGLIPAALILASLLLAYGLVRAGTSGAAPAARPAQAGILEVATFGLLLGLSIAAGLTPGLSLTGAPLHAVPALRGTGDAR